MSFYDYHVGLKLASEDPPFYALIQAAMRKADDINLEKLKKAFLDAYQELQNRYNAPGGYLRGDNKSKDYLKEFSSK